VLERPARLYANLDRVTQDLGLEAVLRLDLAERSRAPVLDEPHDDPGRLVQFVRRFAELDDVPARSGGSEPLSDDAVLVATVSADAEPPMARVRECADLESVDTSRQVGSPDARVPAEHRIADALRQALRDGGSASRSLSRS